MKLFWMGILVMAAMMGAARAADARLHAVLQKLDAGQAITVAAIGGSITTGYAAQPPRERGWAAQVADGLARRGQVKFINAGLSGTDSAVAVQRVQAQVLAQAPDLVLVEFGVNDEWLDERVRLSSYEGLLRQLLVAPKPPAILALMLTQQGNRPRGAVEPQLKLAAHYGLTAIDFGATVQDWAPLYEEPVHPNQRGHDAIAQAVIARLQDVKAPAAARPLPPPLYSSDHQFVYSLAGEALKPWRNSGFVRGGAVHPEWPGQQPGWTSTADEAQASFVVWGSEIAVFHAESEHYRDLEAWVDDGPVQILRGHVPERKGYLGWHYSVVGHGLEPGAHLLHVRVKRDDGFKGSGRPASFIALMAAGLQPKPNEHFERLATPSGLRYMRADDARLRFIGRFDTRQSEAPLLSWSGSEIRARFTGTQLGLRMAAVSGNSHYTVEVDGRRHALSVQGPGVQDWRLREPLTAGPHELRIVKRTEGSQAEARFMGLLLAADAQLLAPPPARPLRLEFYGDSISAGACNGDRGEDQYADLSSHDGTRAYGALVAARLGADYVGIAVSGIGITRTWDTLLMPQIWDRTAPRLEAPLAPVGAKTPDVVVVNLGQNDQGFPASRGEPFAADFGARYLGFVRGLRQRYPQAKLVLTIGGMPAWREQPALWQALQDSARQLRVEGDERVWAHRFDAFSWAHPRIDVHVQMADELEKFLRDNKLVPP